MDETKKRCPACRGPLVLHKTWQKVYLRCRVCSAEYQLENHTDALDDQIEEELAYVRCDRL